MSAFSSNFGGQRRQYARRPDRDLANERPIEVRVGNRRARQGHECLRMTGDYNTGSLQRMVRDAVRMNEPNDALIMVIDGWAPYLHTAFGTIIDDFGVQPGAISRNVRLWNNIAIPSIPQRRGKHSPWTFVTDLFNVPQVYWESIGEVPPEPDDDLSKFVFRMGGWFCGRGAYKPDESVPVILLFTNSDHLTRRIVADTLFEYLYRKPARDLPDMHEGGLAWLFLQLQNLLSDFNNITVLVEQELSNAVADSGGDGIPVKLRARNIYKQVDRIYEMQQYASFQRRGLEKLAAIKSHTSNKRLRKDPIWDEMQDALDDLEQHTNFLDSLKERFNALSDLEFSIENARQSDNSTFLSVLGTLFLPASFLSGIWGISTIKWSPISYLYAVIPVVVVSAILVLIAPRATAAWRAHVYDSRRASVKARARAGADMYHLDRNRFCLLGDDTPSNASVPKIAAASGAPRFESGKKTGHGDGKADWRGDDAGGGGAVGADTHRTGRDRAWHARPQVGSGEARHQQRVSESRRRMDLDDSGDEKGGYRRR